MFPALLLPRLLLTLPTPSDGLPLFCVHPVCDHLVPFLVAVPFALDAFWPGFHASGSSHLRHHLITVVSGYPNSDYPPKTLKLLVSTN